ncbi:MAG TPA: LPXTG cell wall anchor domain-containing protein [Candidatus Limosilactobacillus faecipullorum]|nr:LPXTG cell wall anchor domain-containing protein [Candidatus Limosilactobacillus faecipullorum]
MQLVATKATATAAKQATLPQTGNESSVAATGLGVAALVGMLGLAGVNKRRA